mmetsp:Transcript_101924/g.318560  ORF Transcript_101924/g.318560 Transcript_101924/m.318560 type:complete len:367 (+) Transcript_101924:442-1542(+)
MCLAVILHGLPLAVRASVTCVLPGARRLGLLLGRGRGATSPALLGLLGLAAAGPSAALRLLLALDLFEHPSDHLPHHWLLENLGRRRPLRGIAVQQLLAERLHARRVLLGQLWRRALCDLLDQALQVRRVEGHSPGAHLVENATHRPDVGTPSIGLTLADLGAQVVRSADLRLGAGRGALQDLGDAKVAHLDVAALGQEEVSRLQIPMQDVHVVDVLQRQDGLSEPTHDLRLWEGLVGLPHLLDAVGEVPPLTVVHDDAQPAILVETLAVPHNVGMLQGGQDLALLQSVLPLLPRGPTDVDHLNDGLRVLLPVRVMLHQDGRPEGALANLLQLRVAVLVERRVDAVARPRHGHYAKAGKGQMIRMA